MDEDLQKIFKEIERKSIFSNTVVHSFHEHKKKIINHKRKFKASVNLILEFIYLFRSLCLFFTNNEYLGDPFEVFGIGKYLINFVFCFGLVL